MGFIFSDLVVVPVLRIHAQYYGWRLAAYIAGVFYVATVVSAAVLHVGFDALGQLPQATAGGEQTFFAIDHTFFLNLAFLALTAALGWVAWATRSTGDDGHDHHEHGGGPFDRAMTWAAGACAAWVAGGLLVGALG